MLTSIAHDGPLYLGVASNVALMYAYGFLTPVDALAALSFIAVVASYTNWIHHAMHIEGHCLERFVYFHDLRALHYTHHQGTALHNFGMLDFSGDLAGHALFAPDYALSNRKGPNVPGIAAAEPGGAACASGPGDNNEHLSRVQPGPDPLLARDGLQEVAFFALSLTIERIVRGLGTVFGDAKEVHAKGDTPPIKPVLADKKPVVSAPVENAHVSPEFWGDFFFFN